jgi:hypothetical protein
LILQNDKGNRIPLMSNPLGDGWLPPFAMFNMLIVGWVADRLMSTLALKHHTIGAMVQLFTDGSRLDDANARVSAVVFNHAAVSWANKTHRSCKCEVYNKEIFAIMDELR